MVTPRHHQRLITLYLLTAMIVWGDVRNSGVVLSTITPKITRVFYMRDSHQAKYCWRVITGDFIILFCKHYTWIIESFYKQLSTSTVATDNRIDVRLLLKFVHIVLNFVSFYIMLWNPLICRPQADFFDVVTCKSDTRR